MLKEAPTNPIKVWQMIIGFLRQMWIIVEEDKSLEPAGLATRIPDG